MTGKLGLLLMPLRTMASAVLTCTVTGSERSCTKLEFLGCMMYSPLSIIGYWSRFFHSSDDWAAFDGACNT